MDKKNISMLIFFIGVIIVLLLSAFSDADLEDNKYYNLLTWVGITGVFMIIVGGIGTYYFSDNKDKKN